MYIHVPGQGQYQILKPEATIYVKNSHSTELPRRGVQGILPPVHVQDFVSPISRLSPKYTTSFRTQTEGDFSF